MAIIVVAAIIVDSDRVLIARRSPQKHLGGLWEFPGGKLEPGETPENCLIREIKEELGIEIQIKKFCMQNMHNYANFSILLNSYACLYVSGEIHLIDHDAACWVKTSELYQFEFAPADLPIVNYLETADLLG